LSPEDANSYHDYKEKQMKAYNKKRLIEKNKLGMNNEFNRLKTQVTVGQQIFRAKHFKKSTHNATDEAITPMQNPYVNSKVKLKLVGKNLTRPSNTSVGKPTTSPVYLPN
jgi:hypothetical protein